MFLVDTNVWLENLLEQKRATEAREFFKSVDSTDLFISDFAVHSIGLFLHRGKMAAAFQEFIADNFIDHAVGVLTVETFELPQLFHFENLDFDDSYQLFLKEKFKLDLVSFDEDFSNQKIEVLTPLAAIEKYKKQKQS